MAMTLTIKAAAAELGISEPQVRDKLLKLPGFPAFRIGSRWIIPKDGLHDWIEEQGKAKSEIQENP
jgi:excisionase family DNA binding protein